MSNIFAELQTTSQLNKQSTVVDTRKQLNKIVEFFEHRPDYEELVRTFAESVRNLKVETIKNAHGFMLQDCSVSELPEELQHDSLGFCQGSHFVFDERFVYPVFDVMGDVAGFVGYDKFEEPKYLDSKNHGYIAKRYSFYGMEKLKEYYDSDDIVVVPEGIVCCLALRENGINSLAMLGSNLSPYCIEILKRLGNRAIVFMDADEAGNKLRKKLKYLAPDIRVAQSRVAKDIDDSRFIKPEIFDEIKKLKNRFYQSELIR